MLQLHTDVLRWQSEQGSDRLPNANEEKSLADRIARYMTEEKEKCVRLMRQAYPPDVEAVRLLDLDCLEDSDDMHVGMKWRSEAERALLHSIPGWKEGGPRVRTFFQPLQQSLASDDLILCEALEILQGNSWNMRAKVEKVARLLECSPTCSAIAEGLSLRALRELPEDLDTPMEAYVCRLCDFDDTDWNSFKDHVKEKHSVGLEEGRAFIEYRKKVLGLLEHVGPLVTWKCELTHNSNCRVTIGYL